MKEYIDVMNEVKSITANDATVIVGNVIDDELESKCDHCCDWSDDNYISEIKTNSPYKMMKLLIMIDHLKT